MIDLRQPREVVGDRRCAASSGWRRTRASAARARRRTASDDLLRRQVAHDVEQQPSRHDDAARLVHVGQRAWPRTESSMSVAASSTGASADCASIRTPERICTLERCDTPRATTWRSLEKVVLGGRRCARRKESRWLGGATPRRSPDGVRGDGCSLFSEREPVERSRRVEAVGGCAKYLLTARISALYGPGMRIPGPPGWSAGTGRRSLASAWRKRPACPHAIHASSRARRAAKSARRRSRRRSRTACRPRPCTLRGTAPPAIARDPHADGLSAAATPLRRGA